MLIRRSSHPQLHATLRRIIADDRRHFAFYRAPAKARPTGNRRARRLVRLALPVARGA